MYKTKLELQGIDSTISRPVLINILGDIKNLIGVDKDIKYYLDGQETVDRTVNKLGKVVDNSSPRNEFMQVETSEDSTDGSDVSLLTSNPDNYPIYNDKEIRAMFTPITHDRTTTLTIRYFNKSKSKVNSIANRLKLMTAREDMYKIHNIEYYYTIHNYLLRMLSHFNDIKNARLGTKFTLDEYIATTFDNRVDYGNNAAGEIDKTSIVIREAQMGVIGYLANDLHNIKALYDVTKTAWYLELEYKFSYNKPISLLLDYSPVIFNTEISKEFRVKQPEETMSPINGLRTKGVLGMYGVTEKNYLIPTDGKGYITYPINDKTPLPKPAPFTVRVNSVMLILNKDDLTELFNLSDIPKVKFLDTFTEFLKLELLHIGTLHKSLVYLDIYNGTTKVYNNKVIAAILPNGDISFKTEKPLDITREYRVCFNMLADLNILAVDDRKRIEANIETVNSTLPTSLPITISYLNFFKTTIGEIATNVSEVSTIDVNTITSDTLLKIYKDGAVKTVSNTIKQFIINEDSSITLPDGTILLDGTYELLPDDSLLYNGATYKLTLVTEEVSNGGIIYYIKKTILTVINVDSTSSQTSTYLSISYKSFNEELSFKDFVKYTSDNLWEKYYTVQTYATIASVMEHK